MRFRPNFFYTKDCALYPTPSPTEVGCTRLLILNRTRASPSSVAASPLPLPSPPSARGRGRGWEDSRPEGVNPTGEGVGNRSKHAACSASRAALRVGAELGKESHARRSLTRTRRHSHHRRGRDALP